MSTKNPRLNVVLEPGILASLKKIAHRDGVSLSLKARDLISEALEFYEDRYWNREAAKRDKELYKSRPMSHSEVWKN